MYPIIFAAFLITAPYVLSAQNASVSLSPKRQEKLSSIKSGHKRMARFYQFYKRDSIKQAKKEDKYYKKRLDSLYQAQRKNEKLRKAVEKQGIADSPQFSTSDSLTKELSQWQGVLKDSTSSDSLKTIADERIKEIALERAQQYPGFQSLMEGHLAGDSISWKQLSKHVPGLDTLSGIFNSEPEGLFTLAEEKAVQQLQKGSGMGSLNSEFAKAEELKNMPGQNVEQYGKYNDAQYLQGEGKQMARQEVVDHFANHADKLQGAQTKVSKLLSKYQEFSDSQDLDNAVNRTSMEGKTFWERLVIGGNFNVVSTKPVSLDFSPQLGYKITSRFHVGAGLSYRHTFSDSIQHSWYISPRNTSYRVYTNFDVIKDFYVYGEWECAGLQSDKNDQLNKTWTNNYLVGAGRRFLVHPKLYLTLTALYNLNNEKQNPTYPHRFQVRVGFQTSDLAFRKKKVPYDPNR